MLAKWELREIKSHKLRNLLRQWDVEHHQERKRCDARIVQALKKFVRDAFRVRMNHLPSGRFHLLAKGRTIFLVKSPQDLWDHKSHFSKEFWVDPHTGRFYQLMHIDQPKGDEAIPMSDQDMAHYLDDDYWLSYLIGKLDEAGRARRARRRAVA